MDFPLKNLTQYEQIGLNHQYNLADGHAHQGQTESLKAILARLPDLWFYAEATHQEDLERDFLTTFFRLAGQSYLHGKSNSFLSYSSSLSIEIIANFLKSKEMSVCVLHPTFDNIPAIIRRVGVPIRALDEENLTSESLEKVLDELDTRAIFIVCPNNPTGRVLSQCEFTDLVNYCKRKDKLFIIDFCFRFFNHDIFWDQYSLLQQSDIDFISVEDTGKTWQTMDLKVGITTCNDRLREDIEKIHNDILLNVSPFILVLLIEYLRNSEEQGIESTITSIVKENRQFLLQSIKDTILAPVNGSSISVEWLHIKDHTMDGVKLWSKLQSYGVFVLPGTYFYWDQPEKGNKNIRVALMRPPALFQEAVLALRRALLSITKDWGLCH